MTARMKLKRATALGRAATATGSTGLRPLAAAVLGAGALILTAGAVTTGSADTVVPSAPWCQLDDPASYRVRREALIAAGERDLSKIECPQTAGAAGSLPAEIAMPMPCGRVMVFRRIDVPAAHVLDQIEGSFGRRVDIARETVQKVMSSGPWEAPVSGSFTVARDGADGISDAVSDLKSRSFYMGKYEVTAPQALLWRMGLLEPGRASGAATDPACSDYNARVVAMDQRFIKAAGGFSWYDAIDFSRDYTEWLIARDQQRVEAGLDPDLPWEQGATGVVRLPTEAEWEFAARGGAVAVTSQARSLPLPWIEDPETGEQREAELNEICVEAPTKVDESVGPVGRKAPNLLGLYDTLCNAEEVVLDLFRPTRPDGLHGQVGGYVTKGGSSKFLRTENSVGMRREKELFRLSGEQRVATTGVRLAIAAPVFVGRRDKDDQYQEGMANEPLVVALRDGRAQLLDADTGAAKDSRAAVAREVAQLRERLQAQTVDRAELERRVADLDGRLDSLNVELRDRAIETARQRVRAGVVAANLIDRVGRNMFFAMTRRRTLLQGDKLAAEVRAAMNAEKWREEVIRNKDRIEAAFDLYLRLQLELAEEPEDFVSQQLAAARQGLSGASMRSFGDYLDVFEKHHAEVRAERGAVTETMRGRWLSELDTQRQRRDREFPEFR